MKESKDPESDGDGGLSYNLKAGAFLAFAGGFGLFAGFAGALGQAKKQDPSGFDKGMTGLDPAREAAKEEAVRRLDTAGLERLKREEARALHETGAALARRALVWGSFYAVAGCGILFFSVWKLMNVNNLTEFREKAGGWLPKIPKSPPKAGERTEFSGINDFLNYIIEKDKEEKESKQRLPSSQP